MCLFFCVRRHNIYERIKTLMKNLNSGKSVTYHAVFFPSPYRRQKTFLNGPQPPAEKRTKLDLLDSPEALFSLTQSPSPPSSQQSQPISPLAPQHCDDSISLSMSPPSATNTPTKKYETPTKKYEIATTATDHATDAYATPPTNPVTATTVTAAAAASTTATTWRVGDRLQVFWANDSKWYPCVLKQTRTTQEGTQFWLCHYDGEAQGRWHDLGDEKTRRIDTTSALTATTVSRTPPTSPTASTPQVNVIPSPYVYICVCVYNVNYIYFSLFIV